MTALRHEKPIAADAQFLASHIQRLKRAGDAYEGALTEEGAKEMLTSSGLPVRVSTARGTATFWVKDGILSKVAYHLQATFMLNGHEIEVDQTEISEIRDVGTAKVEVPEGAKKKLAQAAAGGRGQGGGNESGDQKLPF